MSASEVFGDFVRRQRENEEAKRGTLDERGVTVVTSSVGLSTLLFGIATFAWGDRSTDLGAAARLLLSVSATAFAAAACLGLMATRLFPYSALSPNALEEIRRLHWSDSDDDARSVVAHAEITGLEGLREGNRRKAHFLSMALGAQIVAAGAVALIALVFVLESF